MEECPVAWVRTYTAKHMLAGALFGCCFPVMATLIDIHFQSLSLTFTAISAVQAANPLHWIIDTAPIFLGLFAALIGRRQDHILCLNDHLQKQVSELDNACRIANLATQAKSRFLANVSHEIRTPINGILGLTEMMDTTKMTDTQAEFCRIIHDNADGLIQIITDLLDPSKIEAGEFELITSEFNPGLLVADVVRAQSPRAQTKSLAINYAFTSEMPGLLKGDDRRLRQVLHNLIGNAVKFSNDGTINIVVSCPTQSPDETCLKFAITDEGPGIPESKLGTLFHAFSQVDDSVSRCHGGAGLGLAISKNFVEMMGGQIGVVSREGEGSTFWFTANFTPVSSGAQRCDEAA